MRTPLSARCVGSVGTSSATEQTKDKVSILVVQWIGMTESVQVSKMFSVKISIATYF